MSLTKCLNGNPSDGAFAPTRRSVLKGLAATLALLSTTSLTRPVLARTAAPPRGPVVTPVSWRNPCAGAWPTCSSSRPPAATC